MEGRNMKVIYHCYGGSHSSVIAAAIHVGIMPYHLPPPKEAFFSCPLFDQCNPENHGTIHLVGIDEKGNEVYSMGCRGSFPLLKNTMQGILKIMRFDPHYIYFVDTLPYVNLEMRIGGFLSRQWGLISLGRPMVLRGSQKIFYDLVRLVEEVKGDLKKG